MGVPLGAARKPANKQLQPTVIPRHVRAASAPFHYALATRWIAQRAAAELRRYTARRFVPAKSMFPFGTSVEFLADAL